MNGPGNEPRYRNILVPIPTRRLALILAAVSPIWLASGSPAGGVGVALVLITLLALLLFELVTLPPSHAVSVTRSVPSSIGLSETGEAVYSLTSRWHKPLLIHLEDRPSTGLRTPAGSRHVVRLHPFETATVTNTVEAVTRGDHELGVIALQVNGRFGLTQRWSRVTAGGTITVAPSIAAARGFRMQALQARTGQMGERSLRRRGESLSLSGLRQYARGDDPRHIDWKITARQRTPMVREFALEQGQTVMIALDAGRMMTQIENGRARFESALSSALVLASVAADGGDRVGLMIFDDVIRAYIPPMAGAAAVSRIRDALVAANPSFVEPDYAAAFATLAARQRRRALIVVFTDVLDPRSSRALLVQSAASARRHVSVVVALRNEMLVDAAVASADAGGYGTREAAGRAVAETYRNAAAEELLLARAEALERMRRSGATVLDVRSTAMTAAVISAYLDVKARGTV